MSKVIDNRVVSMEFDNSQFEKNVQESMKTLNNLNKTLDNLPETSGKGLFDTFSKVFNGSKLSGISSGIDALNSKFSAFGIASQEVIRDITRSAINFGKNAWDMTFGQIKSGGKNRALNIAEAQFRIEGLGLNYDDYYKSIDDAVTGTAYGFDEAAVAASQFASSGVKAGEDMDHALRSISGMAAMTGRSYSDLASVMEDAAAAGKVTNDTFSRLAERGLPALQEYSKKTGKSVDDIQKAARKGTITFQEFANVMDEVYGEHATKADETFTGVTSNIRAQLSRIGQSFYSPLIENNSALVKMLQSVKQKVKDLKTVVDPFSISLADTVLDLAKRGKVLIDAFDVNKFKSTFDSLTQFVQNANVGLSFSNIIGGIKGVLKALEPIKKAAKGAFSEIFPKKFDVGSKIYDLSKKIAKFGKYFEVSSETVEKSRRIFKGVFATFDLAGKITKSALDGISKVLQKFDGGKVLEFFAKIGDFMVELNENYNIEKPFDTLIQVFDKLKEVGGSLFGSIPDWISNFKGLTKTTDESAQSVEKTAGVFDDFKKSLDGIIESLKKTKDQFLKFISPVVNKIKELAAPIVEVLKPAIDSVIKEIKDLTGNDLYGGLISLFTNSGIVAGAFALNLLTLIKRFRESKASIKSMSETLSNFAKGFSDFAKSIKDLPKTIDKAITTTSKSFQKMLDKQGFEAQTKGILNLAIAIGILAVSLLLIASVPEEKIWSTLGAVEALSLTVVGFMEALSAIQKADDNVQTLKASLNKLSDAFKQSALASSMIKVAVAVLILAIAMKQLQDLNWEDIAQGLTAITVMMLELFAMAVALDKMDIGSFNSIALSFVILAAAIKILADAMVNMQGFNWDDVAQGLVTITVLMAEFFGIAVGLDKLNIKSFLMVGASMISLAKAVGILADAMVAMKEMTWSDVAQGLTVVTVLLGEMFLLAVGFKKFGIQTFLSTAAGMTALATGVAALAQSVQLLGNMDAQNLANGIIAITLMLAELAIVVFVLSKSQGMQKAAFSILAIGAAMMMMANAFSTLGNMKPEQITQAFMALVTTLAGLTIVCYIAQDSLIKAGIGMMLIAAAMDILTIAIKSLGKADIMQLIKGMVAVAAGLVIMVVALKFVEGSLLGAAALLIVSVALVAFSAAVSLLTILPLGDLALTLLAVVVALAALAGVCYLMSGAIVGAAAMLIVGVALMALAVAVGMIAVIPFDKACGGLAALVVAILAFAGVSMLLSSALVPMLALAGVLLVISVAIVALGGGIALLGMGLEAMAVYGAVGIAAFGTFCEILSKNVKVINKVAPALTLLAGALLVLDAGLIVCSASLILMSAAMITFGLACIIFAAALVATVKIIKVAINDFKAIFDKDEFKKTGENAVTGLGDGVKAGASKVWESIKQMAQGCIDRIKSFFGGGANSEMGKAGANGVSGFIAGIKSKLGEVKQAAASIGNSLISKLKSSLKIKSPSRVTMEIGKYVDEGLAIGIDKNANQVTSAAEDMADETVDAMSGALSIISDAMGEDANPTITPELDLSNVQNGVNSMHNMLNQRQAANISANYSAARMAEMEQMSFNQAQLASLGSQIGALSGILANQPTPEVIANVNLVGDAAGVFRQVRNQNNVYTKMHGKSAFA